MCRHFCYLGELVSLRELIFEQPHSLEVQSYAPKDMRGGGAVNADGFGVGWFDERGTARRYRRAVPIWQDRSFAELANGLRSSCVLAAVRNATAGMPVTEPAAAPFTDGRWLFSLNGRIAGWPDAAGPLAGTLPRLDLLGMDAPTDAALIWVALRRRLSQGIDPVTVLTGLVAELLAVAPDSRLNLLLTDGRRIYATTVTHSLWTSAAPGRVLVASEPFDEGRDWQPVPDGQLVVADRDGVVVSALPGTDRFTIANESGSNVDQR
jgi:gamma-glutamyl hercynylcysteine S-oxide hydrolase